MSAFLGIWERISQLGTCGFVTRPGRSQKFVRATGQLFPHACPGLEEDLLADIQGPGGSLEEKLQRVVDALNQGVRRLEALEHVLRTRVLEKPADLPAEVCEVVSRGSYSDSFVTALAGRSFCLHSEEIAPGHEYCLVLEVHSGGPYWAGVSLASDTAQHRLETASSSAQTPLAERCGERCAVLVWRWRCAASMADHDLYGLPQWLAAVLAAEGDDPLRKLHLELQALQRWEETLRQETEQHVRQSAELRNPYIREVLRLWPSEADSHGYQQLKKCAWVEGLEPQFFIGRTVTVSRVLYGTAHAMVLRASIGKRHLEEPEKEGEPPYRLTTSWQWAASVKGEPEEEQGQAAGGA